MKKVMSISICMIALVAFAMWAPDASGTCIPTGVPETVCNGIDDDCDGLIDENYIPVQLTCGVGECAGNTGVEECQNGVIVDTCDPLAGATAEVCDYLDNDCDGATDENLTRPTTCGVGVCVATGVETCISGIWGGDTCTPGPQDEPTDAICDGLDGDCDGLIDEDYVPPLIICDPCSAGETCQCVNGIEDCPNCIPENPSAEICDNLDNDCDGLIDEDLTRPTSCGLGECATSGAETCAAGTWGGDTCTPGTPSAEVCDTLDNDCDGSVDEDCPPIGCGECTSDADCPSGTICNADVLCLIWCTCPMCTVCAGHCVPPPTAAYTMYITSGVAHTTGGFDGQGIGDIPVSGTFKMYVDSNNMVTIEDIAVSDDPSMLNWNDLTGTLTGTALYLMAPSPDPAFFDTEFTGTFNGTSLSMTGAHADPCYDCYQYNYVIQAVVATDNDSDGYAPEFGDCDDNNPLINPGATEVCSNGIDDDCDGLIDVDDLYCTPDCFTNADCLPDFYCDKPDGVCGGQGTCQPRPELCTEEWAPVCGCNGITYGNSCSAASSGVNVDYTGECTPCGGPSGDDSNCNGLDEDCDGIPDDDYVLAPTTCGVGKCTSTGQSECHNGVEIDTCVPGTPDTEGPYGDPTCSDGIDNDCDGMTDLADNFGCSKLVDLDIARFRVSNNVKLGDELKRIQLTVENPNGGGQDMRPATLVGMQNGVEVYNQTRMVFDLSGNGRSRFAFPSFTPTTAGVINWTVEIFDDDPDDDTANASTNVK